MGKVASPAIFLPKQASLPTSHLTESASPSESVPPAFSHHLKSPASIMLSGKRTPTPVPEESSESGWSAQVVASNDDLLSDILLRLPIKTLLQFKSVSKHWLSLITHPRFCRRKCPEPGPVSALFFQYYDSPDAAPQFEFVPLDPLHTSAPFRSLDFAHHRRGIGILQACNGLLCCASVENGVSVRKHYIYNPTTKQFTTLPPLHGFDDSQVLGVNLAFDPSKSPVYKVVICIRNCDNQCQILIYSSETGPWRASGAPFTAAHSVDFQSGVYWNSGMHWVSWIGASLYFDLSEEVVREIPMPPASSDYGESGIEIRYFGESGGHLHLVHFDLDSIAQFDVFEMARDHSAWFVKFRVDLSEVARTYPEMVNYDDEYGYHTFSFSLPCLVRREKEEDSFLVLHLNGQFITYNFMSKSYKEIWNADSPLSFGWSYAFQYMESLALV